MNESQLLDPIQILYNHKDFTKDDAVLIVDNDIKAFGEEARCLGKELSLNPIHSKEKILAPCLVDPHSILLEPFNSFTETIASLRNKAASAGYGQIGLLPRSNLFRDRPERLLGFLDSKSNVSIHLWGSFSLDGEGLELSAHGELIDYGAIGLSDDSYILPTELLQKGFSLGEIKNSPVLLSPRDKYIQANGIVREGINALRAGWAPDPLTSETIPLSILLELQRQYPETNIRLMNLSTSSGVSMLSQVSTRPMATVSWWHLVADSSMTTSTEPGCKVIPSIGCEEDRRKLIEGLHDGILSGVAVHGIPLDDVDVKKPIDERPEGVSGHHLVLPSLWQELVVKNKWTIQKLWEAISFGPSKIMSVSPEKLVKNSNRWLIFDPKKQWVQKVTKGNWPSTSNQPYVGKTMTGKVTDCGLKT